MYIFSLGLMVCFNFGTRPCHEYVLSDRYRKCIVGGVRKWDVLLGENQGRLPGGGGLGADMV